MSHFIVDLNKILKPEKLVHMIIFKQKFLGYIKMFWTKRNEIRTKFTIYIVLSQLVLPKVKRTNSMNLGIK
jgi:hypothetical protein